MVAGYSSEDRRFGNTEILYRYERTASTENPSIGRVSGVVSINSLQICIIENDTTHKVMMTINQYLWKRKEKKFTSMMKDRCCHHCRDSRESRGHRRFPSISILKSFFLSQVTAGSRRQTNQAKQGPRQTWQGIWRFAKNPSCASGKCSLVNGTPI